MKLIMKLISYFLFSAFCVLLPTTCAWAQRPATGLNATGLNSLLYGKNGLRDRYPNLGLSIGVVRGFCRSLLCFRQYTTLSRQYTTLARRADRQHYAV